MSLGSAVLIVTVSHRTFSDLFRHLSFTPSNQTNTLQLFRKMLFVRKYVYEHLL